MTLRLLNILLLSAMLATALVACGDDSDGSAEMTDTGGADDEGPWGVTCAADSDCAAPTDFCVKQPGMMEGYCSIVCATNADCTYTDWTCNAVGSCDSPLAIWCGPPSEIEDGGGVLSACE